MSSRFEQAVCNFGVGLGITFSTFFLWFVLLLFLMFLFLFFFWSLRLKNRFFLSLSLIVLCSGAVSNIIDRVIFGCVVDYISVSSFPAFNVADVFVSLGAFGTVLCVLFWWE